MFVHVLTQSPTLQTPATSQDKAQHNEEEEEEAQLRAELWGKPGVP